jgi:hypothetical protein
LGGVDRVNVDVKDGLLALIKVQIGLDDRLDVQNEYKDDPILHCRLSTEVAGLLLTGSKGKSETIRLCLLIAIGSLFGK